MAGSFRPMRGDSASEMHTDDSKQSRISSKSEEDENTNDVESSLKSGFKTQVSAESDPRIVSFDEDTLVNSYGEREDSVAPTMPDKETSKESPINEELSIDEMVKKVEEKDDIAEESANNYEVWPLLRHLHFTVFGFTSSPPGM